MLKHKHDLQFFHLFSTFSADSQISTKKSGSTKMANTFFSFSYGGAAEAYFLSDVPDKLVEERWQYEMYLDDDDNFGD